MTATSLLSRSNTPLQMLRMVLLFLGTILLIFDTIGFASMEYSYEVTRRLSPEYAAALDDSDKAYYSLYFLPDLFTMTLYTLILALVYRRNRSLRHSSVASTPASSSLSFSAWAILRIVFTLLLSVFMLYEPFNEIGTIRRMVRTMRQIAESKGKETAPSFNDWYLCGRRPTSLDVRDSEVNVMWIYNGCVITRTRSFVAIMVGFLILVELTLSLKKAVAKNKNVGPQKIAFENEKQ